jgi:hypothetical protein
MRPCGNRYRSISPSTPNRDSIFSCRSPNIARANSAHPKFGTISHSRSLSAHFHTHYDGYGLFIHRAQNEIQNDCQNNAQKNRSGERKETGKILALNGNVSGESPEQRNFANQKKRNAEDYAQHTNQQQHLSQFFHCATPIVIGVDKE